MLCIGFAPTEVGKTSLRPRHRGPWSPNTVKVAGYHAFIPVSAHFICRLHVGRSHDRAVGNEAQILVDLVGLMDIGDNRRLKLSWLTVTENVFSCWL